MKYDFDNQQFEQIGASYTYFKQELLPQLPYIEKKSITKGTPVVQHDQVCIIYVKKGEGTFWANGQTHAIVPGFTCVLYFYNFYQLIPNESDTLETITITMDYRSFLYMYGMFHNFDSWMDNSQELIFCYMTDENQKLCENILQKICQSKEDTFWINLEKLYGVTELYARILRQFLNQ